jgi:hypothetical protein
MCELASITSDPMDKGLFHSDAMRLYCEMQPTTREVVEKFSVHAHRARESALHASVSRV